MKKISAILVMVLVFAMTVIPVSAADVDFALSADVTTIAAGETVTITINYTPADLTLNSVDLYLDFDNSLVSFGKATGMTAGTVDDNTKKLVCYTDEYWTGSIGTVTFTALENVNGNAVFSISATTCSDYDFNDYTDLSFAGVTVQVGDGGSEPDPEPVFTVDKAVVDGAVKVTVANAELAEAGKIYVATFNGGVLVDCIEKTIANGTLDFTGLEGDVSTAQMFVWNDQLVPITYATSAQ